MPEKEPTVLNLVWFVAREIVAWILFLIVLWAVFTLSGCSSQHMRLDPKWEPLTSIEQNSICPEHRIVAVGDTVYVRYLGDFLRRNAQKTRLEAVLVHEQVHARRQRTHPLGTFGWCIRYLFDKEFAAEEERVAYLAERAYLLARGKARDLEETTSILRSYWVLTGRLWSRSEAKELAEEICR